MDVGLEGSEEYDASMLEDIFKEDLDDIGLPTIEKAKIDNGFLMDVVRMETENISSKNSPPMFKKNTKRIAHNISNNTKLEPALGTIHQGDTDSSDDEDNKYFTERTYSEYGRSVKDMLRCKEKSTHMLHIGDEKYKHSGEEPKTWKTNLKEIINLQGKKVVKMEHGKSDAYTEPVFGMRLIKPQVSSSVLKDKMVGRTPVLLASIKKFTETHDIKNLDWVTGGVIVAKNIKTSQKGNQYCIWNITDLHGDIKTLSVFLFGSAYKELWKTPVTTIVGILNPNLMENNENTRHEVTLSVDNAQKVMIFGTSKDLGTCKAKKKNGDKCLNIVNLSKCEYCIYHIKQEYKKASNRLELQSSCAGRGLNDLRNKVLGKNEFFYAGKSFVSVPAKKNFKQTNKDNATLKKLNSTPVGSQEKHIKKNNEILKMLESTPQNHLSVLEKEKKSCEKIGISKCESPLLQTTALPKPFSLQPNSKGTLINLDIPVSKKRINQAKLNAINYIKQNGPIPSSEKKVKKQVEIETVKRHLEEINGEGTKKLKTAEGTKNGTELMKEKLNRSGITDDFIKMMKSGSVNQELLKMAETEQQEKYFQKLEMREKMEEKMLNTFKIECKAVRCLKCNYKSFSASDLCKSENHPLKIVNAIKRFWKCGDCSTRTVCLELVPLYSCKNCGSSKWEKTSMMRESKDNNLVRPTLSIRGQEETIIGTVFKGDLNLLVPE